MLISSRSFRNQDADDKLTVAAKRNLFETFSKDTPTSSTLTRSKSFKQERYRRETSAVRCWERRSPCSSIVTSSGSKSPMLMTKKYATGKQRAQTELLLANEDNETSAEQTSEKDIFDDDTSKLSFKEKMVLFNQKKSAEASSSASEKASRNRLTQVFYSRTHLHLNRIDMNDSPTSTQTHHTHTLLIRWSVCLCVRAFVIRTQSDWFTCVVYLSDEKRIDRFLRSQSLLKKFKRRKISPLNHLHRRVRKSQ